jgi:hypothetical protein
MKTAFTYKDLGKLTRQELVDGVKAHAVKNYDRPLQGWDFVVECMTDEEIDRIIGVRTKSILGAIQMMVQMGGIREQAELRASVQAEAGEPSWEEAMDDLKQELAA